MSHAVLLGAGLIVTSCGNSSGDTAGAEPSAEIEGAVLGPSGVPIVGARVFVTQVGMPGSSGLTLGTVTNAQGEFRVATRLGKYLVEVQRDGLVATRATVSTQRARPYHVEFSLLNGCVLHGRAVSALDGAPVRFATVQVVSEREVTPRTTCTDSDGRFDIGGLPPGLARVFAASPEHATYESTTTLLLGEQQNPDLELRLAPAFSIKGKVLDADPDNLPVFGAQIEARNADTGLPVPFQATSDAAGAFTIAGVAPGRYSLAAIHDRFQSPLAEQFVEVIDSDVEGRTLPMRRGFSVIGRIRPAARAAVKLLPIELDFSPFLEREHRPSAKTHAALADADGRFELPGITPGRYQVVAEAQDGRYGETQLEARAGGNTELALDIEARASIHGRVVDTQGRAVRNMVVTAEPAKRFGAWMRRSGTSSKDASSKRGPDVTRLTPTQGVRHETTDWAGGFSMFGLSAGDYELRVHTSSGYQRLQGSSRAEPGKATPKVVRLHGTRTTDLELVLSPCDGAISGVVQYVDGGLARFAHILLSPTNDLRDAAIEGLESYSVVTDARGLFSIGGLCGTSYRLVAASNGQYAEQFGVPIGAMVPLQLTQAAALSGTVSHGGQAVGACLLELQGPTRRRESLHAEDGSFAISWLSPGTYQVSATTRDAYAETKLVLEAGSATTIDLAMRSWSTARGQLTCVNGQPLDSVDVTLLLDRSTANATELGSASWALNTLSTRTNGSGQFRFERLRSGHGRLMFFQSMQELQLQWAKGNGKTGPQTGPSPWVEFEIGAEQDLDLDTLRVRCP